MAQRQTENGKYITNVIRPMARLNKPILEDVWGKLPDVSR
jgi:hypothetical protein